MRRVDHITGEIFDETEFDDGLDETERSQLLEITERRFYEPEEIIVREGDKSRDVFVLKSGRAEVAKLDDGANERRLALLEPGAVFGEIALVLGGPRSATVRAVEDAELLCIDGGAVQTLRQSGKMLAYKLEHNILCMLARRQSNLNAELMSLMDEPEEEQTEDDHEDVRQRLLDKWTF